MATLWYLDENVSERLAILLVLLGNDAIGTTAAGNNGASDATQLLFALRSGRTPLTHNANDSKLIYETLLLRSAHRAIPNEHRHAGILVFPDSGQLSTPEAAKEIDRVASETADFSNLLLFWVPGSGWVQVP